MPGPHPHAHVPTSFPQRSFVSGVDKEDLAAGRLFPYRGGVTCEEHLGRGFGSSSDRSA